MIIIESRDWWRWTFRTFLLLCLYVILSPNLVTPSSAVYYYCPDTCSCDTKRATVKCAGDGINSTQIPSGIDVKTIQLSIEYYNFSTLNTTRLWGLKRLRDLRLRRNGIYTIGGDCFENIRALASLDLSSNRITTLEDSTFTYLTRLRNLDLSNNSLISLGTALQKLVKLVQLNLGSNRLTRLFNSTFSGCRELRYLYVEKNMISKIEPATFLKQVKLSKLKLKSNKLADDDLGMTFQRYLSGNLRTIDLSDNQLTAVPEHLPIGLQEIRLASNLLSKLGSKNFEGFYRLEFLYLQNNTISEIHNDSLIHSKVIKKIWLNANALTSVPLHLPDSLADLYLQDNDIGPLITPANFSVATGLSRLHMQNNKIKNIAPESFKSLGLNLKTLMLHNNEICGLVNRTFYPLKNLNILSLSRNPLVTFETDCLFGLSKLKILRLSHIGGVNEGPRGTLHSFVKADDYDENDEIEATNLQSVKTDVNFTIFINTPNLQMLTLTNSSGIARSLLFHHNGSAAINLTFGRLVEIEIGDNGLENLPYDFFQFFPKIMEINVSGNDWKCDDQILPILNLINNPTLKIADKNELTCHSPERFQGRALVNLSADEIEEVESPILYTADILLDEETASFSTDSIDQETTTDGDDLKKEPFQYTTHHSNLNCNVIINLTTPGDFQLYNELNISDFYSKDPPSDGIIIWVLLVLSLTILATFIIVTLRYTIRNKLRYVDSYARFNENSDALSLMSENDEGLTNKNAKSAKVNYISCYFKRGSSNIQIINSINPRGNNGTGLYDTIFPKYNVEGDLGGHGYKTADSEFHFSRKLIS